MARRPRIDFAGAIQHVTTRGVARGPIYLAEIERRAFLTTLAMTIDQHNWTLIAYCLMGNHYHLLLRTERANLAIGMKYLNACHAQRFNRMHDRPGHLFGGRYWSTVVEDESHLIEAGRYIALNPVRAKLCREPERWRWSSYRATIGLEQPPSYLDPSLLLAPFGATTQRARRAFRAYVDDAITAQAIVNGM
jgi:REP element-mobilizing transposase RayT